MSSVSGADIADMRKLAQTLSQAAQRIDGVIGNVQSQISSTAWTGPDANRYRSQWQSDSTAKLRSVSGALRDASKLISRNASEQEHASAATGGSTPTASAGANKTDPNKSAPTSTSDLYARLRQVTGNDLSDGANDGVYVEKVKDPTTGQIRAIVYLGGTTWGAINQPIVDNAPDFLFDAAKQEQIAAINNALQGLPKSTPIMLAGYSQGGMDAQILAQSGKLNGDVAAVVTYGSPIVEAPGGGYTTVHLQDVGDIVPKEFRPDAEAAAIKDGDVFVGASRDDLLGPGLVQGAAVHMDPTTYEQDGAEFDAARGYGDAKSAMDQFRGQVVN